MYDEVYSTRKEQKKPRMHSGRMCTARTPPHGGVSVMETPSWTETLWKETPWTETPVDRDPLRTEIPREQNNTQV